MNHIMLDLETWGTRPGFAIRSIGAVVFDLHSQALGAEFYCNVSRADCEAAGLKIDATTEAWWQRQSAAARAALEVDPVCLRDALWQFNGWWVQNRGEFVWSHGANFDQPILEACYAVVGMQPPWSFWNSRCTRTLFDIAGIDGRKMAAGETKHNAADDARIQARAAQAAYARLRGNQIIGARAGLMLVDTARTESGRPVPDTRPTFVRGETPTAAAPAPVQPTANLTARSIFE